MAYDLNSPGQDYGRVIAEVERTAHFKILKSSWLVDTAESAHALRDRIAMAADANDRFFISGVTGNHGGMLDGDAWDWLRGRLRFEGFPI